MSQYYVSTSASGSGDGSSGNPWTIAQAVAGAVSGDTVYIKAGTYTEAASRTFAAGVIVQGYNSTVDDLYTDTYANAHNANGTLTGTNYPVVNMQGNILTMGTWGHLRCVSVTHSRAGQGFVLGFGGEALRCKFAFTDTSSTSARAVGMNPNGAMLDCDLSGAGKSGGYAMQITRGCIVQNVRVTSTSGGGIDASVSSGGSTIKNCVFYTMAASQTAIACLSADSQYTVTGCTFDGITGTCITLPNSAATNTCLHVSNNQVTNCGTFCNNLRSGTTRTGITGGYNRIRNTTTPYTGFLTHIVADGTGYLPGDVTTSQTDANEYVNLAGSDYHLKNSSAVAVGIGIPPYMDTGAFQLQQAGGAPPIHMGAGGLIQGVQS